MDNHVIGWNIQNAIHLQQNRFEHHGQRFVLPAFALFKERSVLFGQNPCFKSKAWSERGDRYVTLIFSDHPDSVLFFLRHDIAINTAFLVPEICSRACQFFTRELRNDGKSYQL